MAVAVFKAVNTTALENAMEATADAIRTKKGTAEKITWDSSKGFATAINGIETGGGTVVPVLQEKTVDPSTSKQVVTYDSGYGGLSQVTVNAMPTATQATPSISVSSGGLITASATQSAGYVPQGTKSATKQLTTQVAKTVTPSTSEQTAVASGTYTTGAVKVAAIQTETKTVTPTASNQDVTPSSGKYLTKVTVSGDSNLVASNIKSGVKIFGVTGTHQGGITPSGTIEIKSNGTHDVSNYASAVVAVPTGGGAFPSVITAGDTPILMPATPVSQIENEAWVDTGMSVTLTKNGTYRIKYGGSGG